MAQSRAIQSGAYAEALLAEFDKAVAEVQEVIDSEKGSKDKKIFFLAVAQKTEILAAKAKALGFGATPGRPNRNEVLPAPEDLSRDDLHQVAAAFLKAQEQPPAPPEPEPEDEALPPLAADPTDDEVEAWIKAREQAAAVVDGAESVVAGDEVTSMDADQGSNPG